MISGGHTVYTGNERVSQGWFITGTVTEYSWQQGHESALHSRQDTATWQAGPDCHHWFLQLGLKRTLLISVSLLSQEYWKGLAHQTWWFYIFVVFVLTWDVELTNLKTTCRSGATYLCKPGPTQTSDDDGDDDSTRPEEESISVRASVSTHRGGVSEVCSQPLRPSIRAPQHKELRAPSCQRKTFHKVWWKIHVQIYFWR